MSLRVSAFLMSHGASILVVEGTTATDQSAQLVKTIASVSVPANIAEHLPRAQNTNPSRGPAPRRRFPVRR